jgi:hypothetical protein
MGVPIERLSGYNQGRGFHHLRKIRRGYPHRKARPRADCMGLNRFDGVSRVEKDRQSCRPSQNDCKHVNAKTNDSFNRIMAASFPQGLELAVAA